MKICHIGWATSPHTARWVKWFAVRGHDSCLITDQGEIEGVKTYTIPMCFGEDTRPRWKRYMGLSFNDYRVQKIRFKILRIKWLRDLIKEINPDILHSHALWYPGSLGPFLGVRNFVVTVMNGDVLYHHGRDASFAHHLLVKYAMKKAKMVTGVSKTLIDAAQKHGANKEKTHVIRRGVDFALFNANRDKIEIKQQLGLRSKYIVLSPRYLAPMGNVITLIRAVPLILREITDVQFVFIYPGDYEKETAKLKNLGEKLRVSEHLFFVGSVPHNQVPLYHRAADVMISIPLDDSGPIAMQEAMACGDVPIMSDLPCVREWVKHDWNGVLVPAEDFQRLAYEIIRLLQDDGRRSLFAQRNQQLIGERGDQDLIMEEVERLYYELLSEDRRNTL